VTRTVGSYSRNSPSPRTWAIAAEVEHYEPFTQDVVGLQAGETRDVSVTLTAVIVFASVVGEVWLDDGYLDPMEAYNVPIQLMADDRTFRTETDYDGAFTFDYVPITREWTLSVDLEGYPPFTETVRGLAEGEERSVFVMLAEIDPPLPWHWQTGSELGQLAPDFTLPDSDGNLISLSSYRDRSNVLLAFHQGVLCPVCPAQLGQLLSSHNAEVEALAWKTLAISHETVANNQRLTLLHNVPFPMLADTSRQTIRDYDIADPLLGISKTAFFLIDLDGSIQWKSTDHSNVDPNDLPEWEDIRRELEEHAGRVAY
jgi:peroxiredoxin